MSTNPDQILKSNEAVTFDESERQANRADNLKKMVPVLTVIALISLIIYPILASRENSFTLAIDRLPERDEKAKLIKPSYVDIDRNNNPVNISAQSAYREENEHTDYFFTNLLAQMSLPSGEAIEIEAMRGALNTGTQIMDLGGEITILSETGFLLTSTEATFFIADKIAAGKNGVKGIAPFGRFSANTFNANVEEEIITLEGNVTINFDPKKPLNLMENTSGNIN
ncbi:MAG: LPS export ABC transporter periplasmic protein LptC [Emcibacteraceae bacterium]|uniref:LPS export ABC transporter periplasmic protein LptC n=1 Tax=Pseudemcibacter sp. TaxID=2943293 RepID=UPI003F6969A9|nr:LPS export ABC transporter periplasmic protein LptC [Emcibacteraceae bacterium]MDG1727416.1 LPS export ABC transporter periplasmic protein LptC [Emcibacteraceae bacterium]